MWVFRHLLAFLLLLIIFEQGGRNFNETVCGIFHTLFPWLVRRAESKLIVLCEIIIVGLSSKFMSREGSKGSASATSFSHTPRTEGEILKNANLKSFTLGELKSATRSFRPDSMVGEGGFGCVFKGWIDETSLSPSKPGTGIVIAVKKLNQEGLQGHREWLVSHHLLFHKSPFQVLEPFFFIIVCRLRSII